MIRPRRFVPAVGVVLLLASARLFAGFPSTEVFLPSVGRIAGANGAEFFTTIWVTDLTTAPVTFTFEFLKAGQANPSPASFSDALQPGQTKEYENVVEAKLGLHSALGAARVTSTGEILVAERIFDQAPGADLGETEGLFFAGVPATLAISLGQSASIQGVNQGGAENFRYNFALVETTGASAQVNVQVFDGSGTQLGQKAYTLQPFEQIQPNVTDVVPGFSSNNARITATVTGGAGHALLAGAQVANVSQDSSGFEMSFRDDLFGGGTAGVTSLNGLAGALTLTAGNGISITPSGSSIAIAFTGGGSTGITSVTHDASLSGAGTGASPLAIANGQVVRSLNGLHDAVTLAAGSNITLTPSGNTLTIGSTGGGSGGLTSVSHDATLGGSGTGASPLGVAVPLSLGSTDVSTLDVGMTANNGAPAAVVLSVTGSTGGKATALSIDVAGTLTNNDATAVRASVHGAVRGIVVSSENSSALVGEAGSGVGVDGFTETGAAGVRGDNRGTSDDTAGVLGVDGTGTSGQTGQDPAGVRGESRDRAGVLGLSAGGFGIEGLSDTGSGVFGETTSVQPGVLGLSGGFAGVFGKTSSSSDATAGVFGVDKSGFTGVNNVLTAGVHGESSANIGVLGLSKVFAVVGTLGGSGVQGELGTHRESQNFGVYSFGNVKFNGTMTATGTKSFVEPHPTDATKEIRFVCLEGPEAGTYFRGRGRFQGGIAAIEVPESFRSVTDAEGLTVVATPVGGPAVVWVAKLDLDRIVLQASSDVEFHYVVNGVRKSYRDFQAIGENESFVPDGPDDRRFALYAPEIQRRLVATGIYHADGTVNLETAKRLGWDRTWRREDDAAR